MDNRVFYRELECGIAAIQNGKSLDAETDCYDLSLLPTDTMKEEFRRYLLHRGKNVSLRTVKADKTALSGNSALKKETPQLYRLE